MRSLTSLTILIAYAVSMNLYTLQFYAHPLPPYQMKTWWNLTNFILLIYNIIDQEFETTTYLQLQFNRISKYLLSINILIVIFTCQSIIINAFQALFIFNGAVFIASITILISAIRHDTFKN